MATQYIDLSAAPGDVRELKSGDTFVLDSIDIAGDRIRPVTLRTTSATAATVDLSVVGDQNFTRVFTPNITFVNGTVTYNNATDINKVAVNNKLSLGL